VNKKNKIWTEEENLFLEENWGFRNLSFLSQKISRSKTAIRTQAYKLNLGSYKDAGAMFTVNDISKLIKKDHKSIEKWIKELQMMSFTVEKIKYYKTEAVHNLLEKYQDKWHSENLEMHILGPEPAWLKQKRKKDKSLPVKRLTYWNKEDTDILIRLYRIGQNNEHIAKVVGRSEYAVQRKISRLKKERILPLDKILIKWTNQEIDIVKNLLSQGVTHQKISEEIGRAKDSISYIKKQIGA